jgi:hypothetical protein
MIEHRRSDEFNNLSFSHSSAPLFCFDAGIRPATRAQTTRRRARPLAIAAVAAGTETNQAFTFASLRASRISTLAARKSLCVAWA